MKYSLIVGLSAAFALSATASQAAIIGVNDPGASSAGTMAEILPTAPMAVNNGSQFNTGMQGFDERQNVVLASAVSVDNNGEIANGGVVAAGTRVDSHMIFLNKQNGVSGRLSHEDVVWSFSGEILGVISGTNGADEAASNAALGAVGTTYPGAFSNRGLENNDSYSVFGNELTVSMFVTQPGDWIRVITASPIPVPGALPLMLAGLAGLGGLSRRRREAK
ncbi:MAG: hypothetical protein AAFX08_10905 [Pseudomonadota bacterium]